MVVTSKWAPVPLRQLLTLCLQGFACRRAMVNKIWCRKLSRAWHQKQPEPPHPRAFSEPRCQDHVATWYLCYRWLICLAWAAIIVCSIWEFGSYKPIGKAHLWPIYLTNWDLALGLVQATLAVHIVTTRWSLQRSAEFDACNLSYGRSEKIYWFLYTVTSALALAVTGTYWATVHDPKIHHVDPLNVMLHICNSLLMLVDLCVTSVPLRIRHFWWSFTVVTSYVLFTIVYYTAGGVDKHDHRYIYKVLDWGRPGKTLVVCLGCYAFLFVVHCLLCYVAMLRDRLYSKSSKYLSEAAAGDVEQSPKVKQLEIV